MALWRSCENEISVHGTLVRIGTEGLLLRGEPGVGKSTAALEYLALGGQLVADDIVTIKRVGNELYGSAPSLLEGILSVPEMGIFDVREVLGLQYFATSSVITRSVGLGGLDDTVNSGFVAEFHGVRLSQTYRKVDRSRKPKPFPVSIDLDLLKQSESRFFRAHSKNLAAASFA